MEISFWNMWPACHADCSRNDTRRRRRPDWNITWEMCAPVSRFEFSMSNQLAPKMFVRACLFRLPVFISITSHPARLMSWNILRTFFAVANVKRSYKVRSFGRRLLFSNQRAKIGVWINDARRLANLNSAFTCCRDVSRFSLSSSCKFISLNNRLAYL